jgi:hypothetical protein
VHCDQDAISSIYDSHMYTPSPVHFPRSRADRSVERRRRSFPSRDPDADSSLGLPPYANASANVNLSESGESESGQTSPAPSLSPYSSYEKARYMQTRKPGPDLSLQELQDLEGLIRRCT